MHSVRVSRMTRHLSVRKHGEIVEIRIYSAYHGRDDYFRGKARLNNEKELDALFEAACANGLKMPAKSWFR